MLDDVIQLLRCPHCHSGLRLDARVVRCPSGHAFDVARQGYLSLLTGDARSGSADTSSMVAARAALFASRRFDAIVDAVAADCAEAVRAHPAEPGASREAARGGDGCLVDVGAGTGVYLAAALRRLPGRTGLALDLSKHALRRAARAHPAIGAVRCDAWRELPVREHVAAVALSVFAPRDTDELARILAPGGTLVVAGPTDRHLAELVEPLGLLEVDARRRERLERKLGDRFEPVRERLVERTVGLDREQLAAVAAMGPSARHLEAGELDEDVARLPEPFAVTLSVTVSAYRRHGARAP